MNIEKAVTGDHAEISVLTKSQQRMKIVESLPKNIQESIYHLIIKYFGHKKEDAKEWLQSIEDFVAINSLNLSAAFDLLLHGDAKELWTAFKERIKIPSEEDTKNWFISKYIKSKTFLQKIEDMSRINQRSNERYENFVIRVRKMVQDVLSVKQTEDAIVKDIISKRMCYGKVKELIAMNSEMSLEEIERLTINFENSMGIEENSEIIAIEDNKRERKTTYATVAGVNRPIRHNRPQIIKPSVHNQGGQYFDSNKRRQDSDRRQPMDKSNEYDKFQRPVVSMKHIARRVYNRAKGLPEPELRRLRPGECYCCGESGHVRNNCPLIRCCLICGKDNHFLIIAAYYE